MQKESYDIDEVKDYFLYHSFSQNHHGYNDEYRKNMRNPSFIVESIISSFMGGVFILCCMIGIFFIDIPIMYRIMFSSLGFLGITFFLREFIKSYKIQQLYQYFNLKKNSISFLNKFEHSTNKDIFIEGVNLIEINHMKETLRDISRLISLVSGPLIEFRKISSLIPLEARIVLEKFIRIEVQWLTEYIEEFRDALTTWMEVHQAELTEYQKKNLLSKNEEIFTLASSRLSSHIGNVEKVRARL